MISSTSNYPNPFTTRCVIDPETLSVPRVKRYEESDNLSGVKGIRRSFSDSRQAIPRPVGAEGRRISYGDRLFARLIMHGRTVVEFMVNSINDLSEFWGELRRKCRGISGLARLYLRNASRGWSLVRPLMIYPEGHPRAQHSATPRTVATTACTTYISCVTPESSTDNISRAFSGEARQLSFPWEL